MNPARLRPPKGDRVDLETWLSGVVHDAIRDVEEAGLPERTVHSLLSTITDMHDPDSYKYKYRSTTVATNTKPATLFDIRGTGGQKGTLLIADFNDKKSGPPDFLATLAPPPFASSVTLSPPTQSAAVRAVAAQVKDVLDQLTAIAANLEQNGR